MIFKAFCYLGLIFVSAITAMTPMIAARGSTPSPLGQLIDPHQSTTKQTGFGAVVVPLPGGNVVVTAPFDSSHGQGAGAVYLYNGATHALISALYGNFANDEIGSGGVVPLKNGNYVVISPRWHFQVGAVTWGSGTTGVKGTVSQSNSLVGTHGNANNLDQVGSGGILPLTNGNYVVLSPSWNGNSGAATWGSGKGGVHGPVTAANSLIGNKADDFVGSDNTGVAGAVALTDGNYVVDSCFWHNVGAVTWGNGVHGVAGMVSASNSLVGTISFQQVGGGGITVLTNGNYVVNSPNWFGGYNMPGAITWAPGANGLRGNITAANSLVGGGAGTVTALANGNYVVASPNWGVGGAVTWASGSKGIKGIQSAAGSLVGDRTGDALGGGTDVSVYPVFGKPGGVTPLANGNYVVVSPHWHNELGAVTWGNGKGGLEGKVTSSNSLVGQSPAGSGPPTGDAVGSGGVSALTNGAFAVTSPFWSADRGAVTFGSGAGGLHGTINASNSLVGTTGGSQGDFLGSGGTVALAKGGYVVVSPSWRGGKGAATWEKGSSHGAVSASNSLIGRGSRESVGSNGVTALTNGDYVVGTPNWTPNASSLAQYGAATWASGSAGIKGFITAANSLVGTHESDQVGGNFDGSSITALSNGNYLVIANVWNNMGAITEGKATGGTDGAVTKDNSITGFHQYRGQGPHGEIYLAALGHVYIYNHP